MAEVDWLTRFSDAGALWEYRVGGRHAVYTLSGKHSDFYFNTNYVVQNPQLLRLLCTEVFVHRLDELGIRAGRIVSYPPFGSPVAFCLAETLGAKFAYTKSTTDRDCDFDIQPTERIVVAADDIYSGERLRTTIAGLPALQVENVICAIGNFSGSAKFDGKEIVAAISRKVQLWTPDECPLCRAGSEAIMARSNWELLRDQ